MDEGADRRSRAVMLGEYIVDNGATVRSAAARFSIGKSTVHKDVTERLQHIDRGLWMEVRKVLSLNKSERHLRGGEATRQKYAAGRRAGKKSGGKTVGK